MQSRVVLLMSITLISISLMIGCSSESTETINEVTPRPVKTIEIGAANGEEVSRYPAVIGAGEIVELSFQVGGVVNSIPVNEATEVNQGDLIADLEPRDYQNALDSARASYTNAEEEYQRAVRLAEEDAIAQNTLEQRRTQRDVTKSQLDSAEKALSDTMLKAPFTGVIASLPIREQQSVGAGTTVATLINVETLEATINLPASVIAATPMREDRGATVLLDAVPGREIPAQFSEADLVADATSQTYSVTFSFDEPEGVVILPGMNATVVLRSAAIGSEVERIAVPLAAILSDGQGQYVWLVDDSYTVARRDITVSPGVGEAVVVTSGLSPGDTIVGAGGAYLAEGMTITPWEE